MKKRFNQLRFFAAMAGCKNRFVAILLIAALCSGCGTVFGGHISQCQKTKPTDGTHRKVRPAALVFDIFGALPIIAVFIDMKTGGLYKPCQDKK